VARNLLAQLCDHALCLEDFEPVLAAIGPWLPQPGSAVSVPLSDGSRAVGIVIRTEASETGPRVFVAVPVADSAEPLPQAFSAHVVMPVEEAQLQHRASPSPSR
jgi:primosomal protein N'